MAQNLMGLSDDPFVLKGDAYCFDKTEFESMEISTVISVYNSLVYLAYFMCDDVNGADWALELYTMYTEEQMDPVSALVARVFSCQYLVSKQYTNSCTFL